MKNKLQPGQSFKFTFLLFFSAMLAFQACKPKEDDDIQLLPIELTGTQSTPITLTNRISDPNVPDYFVSGSWVLEANVTVEPGVYISMKNSSSIIVQNAGSLNAVGTSDDPIHFRGESPTPGYWEYLLFTSNNVLNHLEHVIFEYGGGNNSWDGTVYCYSNGRLKIRNTSIRNSGNHGMVVYNTEFVLDEFSGNHFQQCALAPVNITASHMHRMDENTVFENNPQNRIEVSGGQVTQAQTWRKTQAPFHILSSLYLNANVTVNPGAVFQMGPSSYIVVEANGSLRAIGTAAEKIIFTAAQNTPGYWDGIRLINTNNINNEFQYTEVTYGGGNTSWNAAIYLYDNSRFRLGNSLVANNQYWGLINYYNTSDFTDDGNNVFQNNGSGDIGD